MFQSGNAVRVNDDGLLSDATFVRYLDKSEVEVYSGIVYDCVICEMATASNGETSLSENICSSSQLSLK